MIDIHWFIIYYDYNRCNIASPVHLYQGLYSDILDLKDKKNEVFQQEKKEK